MGLKGCQNANEAMRALSAGGELPGGLQKQVMKAINIAHVARSFILEIYMYFKHSELEGISGKRKFLVVSCDRSLVKSFGQVLWLGPGHTGLVKSFGQVIWLPLKIYFL